MSQKYKNIYFQDFPAESSKAKNFTLAFGAKDKDIYDLIRTSSSQDLREILGHSSYVSLQQSAKSDGLALNTYCLRVLKQKRLLLKEDVHQYNLPGLPGPVLPFGRPA